MQSTFYHITTLNIVGRKGNDGIYIYDKALGWIKDSKFIIMDRLMGYDESEPSDSPYAIGNLSIMNEIKEITEEKAYEIIAALKKGYKKYTIV